MIDSTLPLNRLAHETSLYLRQHARNPVNWFPWGDEAIQEAKRLQRPIFLSIGYSACHWCHVMEHESFENSATARLLNDHFISIKVDREERPDLDSIYMSALHILTSEGGGWPLSVWLTPDLQPFYAGTYYPPDDRYAPHRPSFPRLLTSIAEVWINRREKIIEQAGEITQALAEHTSETATGGPTLGSELLSAAGQALQRGFDSTNGGFGMQPKFPHPLELRVLLRIHKRFGSGEALHMVRHTLDKMARGGIYDQIGGGFHRYSVDSRWLVPHFEKMLYDNALLTSAYVEAWQVTNEATYRETVCETLDYVLREMTSEAGAFYSTQDADSEGEEGKFYVWSRMEINDILGAEEAELFCRVYDVTDGGNFEGHNILNRGKPWDVFSRMEGIEDEKLRRRLAASGQKLYVVRSKRIHPGRDEKILTSWNGLMIAAFASAGRAFDEPRYTQAAARAADFVLNRLRTTDGKLFHTCGADSPPKLNGYLEDYTFLVEGLLQVFESTADARYLEAAVQLAETMIAQFADLRGGFFFTGIDHESLIVRTKDTHDGSTPSGNSMAATILLKLATLTSRDDFRRYAESTLRTFAQAMHDAPGGTGQMLCALDFHLGPIQEVVVIGSKDDAETRAVLQKLHHEFGPRRVVVFHDPSKGEPAACLSSLLQGRTYRGHVTTYICENGVCGEPQVGMG